MGQPLGPELPVGEVVVGAVGEPRLIVQEVLVLIGDIVIVPRDRGNHGIAEVIRLLAYRLPVSIFQVVSSFEKSRRALRVGPAVGIELGLVVLVGALDRDAVGGSRITIQGTYKYDQTQLDPYGWADAECATGFLEGTDYLKDANGQPVSEKTDDLGNPVVPPVPWNYHYVPNQYKYFLNDKSGLTDGTYNNFSDGKFGTEWLPHRFQWKGSTTSGSSGHIMDGADVEIGWGGPHPFVDWR